MKTLAFSLLSLVFFSGIARAQAPDLPKIFPPTAAQSKTIADKTAELGNAIENLRRDKKNEDWLPDVEIFHNAAINIVEHKEFFNKDSAAWTIEMLDKGLARAIAIASEDISWTNIRGKTIVRGYRSKIDATAQPYAVSFPLGFGKNGKNMKWRTDVVLHGRDSAFTEVAFLRRHEGKKAENTYIEINVAGRGNNAYRWAGETDVFEAIENYFFADKDKNRSELIDRARIVLRGFSMGGAGTWHLGLHHPDRWCVMSPGAGFTTTHGYIGGLPAKLAPHQEACLSIYDAVNYAPNAAMIPIVAYSGGKDPQKAAADNIEARLKPLGLSMIHLVAPDEGHRFPPEYFRKAEALWTAHTEKGRAPDNEIRFVTYSLKYSKCDWIEIHGLQKHYEKAEVHAKRVPMGFEVTTRNVSCFRLKHASKKAVALVGGQVFQIGPPFLDAAFGRTNDRWVLLGSSEGKEFEEFLTEPQRKSHGLQGPIDDAFTKAFLCVRGTGKPWHAAPQKYADENLARFQGEWSKYMRGRLIVKNDVDVTDVDIENRNLVLVGDPASNSLIAKVINKLPLQWSDRQISFASETVASSDHVPVLIYRNPLNPNRYVVLNSGHTFHAKEFQGTNAQLYPRLGDYALLKLAPTADDPLHVEVVRAGLFDEFWKIPAAK